MLTRRTMLGGLGSFQKILTAPAEQVNPGADWLSFKSRFMSADGRIVDNGNAGVSHSEGQGWGLLFAVAAQDQASFNLIFDWTARYLRRPHDALHAWRYIPGGQPPVADLNNAVDGDLFIAAALVQAGRIWKRPDHLRSAAAIGRDILRLLVRRVGPLTILLPGIQGFETPAAVIVNPSYYAFPMITTLAGVVPSPQWDRLQRDGRALIEQGRFGRWSLPPDWLRIDKVTAALSPAPGWPPRFSYDAVRVPLWWMWQRLPVGPAIQSIRQFWSMPSPSVIPAWIDLETNEAAPYSATPGMIAIMRLTRPLPAGAARSEASETEAPTGYYDSALILLSRIAEREMMSF